MPESYDPPAGEGALIADLEAELAEAQRLGPALSDEARRAEENAVILYLAQRDGTLAHDRLRPRMEARDLINVLDEHRARHAR